MPYSISESTGNAAIVSNAHSVTSSDVSPTTAAGVRVGGALMGRVPSLARQSLLRVCEKAFGMDLDVVLYAPFCVRFVQDIEDQGPRISVVISCVR